MIRLGLIIFASTLLIMSGCAGLKDLPKYQLKNDYYLFKQAGAKPIDVFVDVQEDTLILISANKMAVDVKPGKDQALMKKSFDVDIMTVLFKYRPQTLGFPRQLNSTFNGNVYFGYRKTHLLVQKERSITAHLPLVHSQEWVPRPSTRGPLIIVPLMNMTGLC
jgi:hypothetical protein